MEFTNCFKKNVFQQFLKNLSNIPDLQKHFFLTSKMPLNLKEKIYSYVACLMGKRCIKEFQNEKKIFE